MANKDHRFVLDASSSTSPSLGSMSGVMQPFLEAGRCLDITIGLKAAWTTLGRWLAIFAAHKP